MKISANNISLFGKRSPEPWNFFQKHISGKDIDIMPLIWMVALGIFLFFIMSFFVFFLAFFFVFRGNQTGLDAVKVKDTIKKYPHSYLFFFDYRLCKFLAKKNPHNKEIFSTTLQKIEQNFKKLSPQEFHSFLLTYWNATYTPPTQIPSKNPTSYQAPQKKAPVPEKKTIPTKEKKTPYTPGGKSVWDDYESVLDTMKKTWK